MMNDVTALDRSVAGLAQTLGLSSLLQRLDEFALLDHWQQGEFHHDVLLRTRLDDVEVVLVVATNCNGGIKEVSAFDAPPDRWALWLDRCPGNGDFAARAAAELPPPRARARTLHWFDPCELLVADARSELKPSCRKRSVGGGFEPA